MDTWSGPEGDTHVGRGPGGLVSPSHRPVPAAETACLSQQEGALQRVNSFGGQVSQGVPGVYLHGQGGYLWLTSAE